uniref:Plastid lipid-associated protein/fibrillin conserved domain-containing protein n=1 Tax=Odontella aurita TaxID=265563 RepID=A0A7S4JRF5_9STRA
MVYGSYLELLGALLISHAGMGVRSFAPRHQAAWAAAVLRPRCPSVDSAVKSTCSVASLLPPLPQQRRRHNIDQHLLVRCADPSDAYTIEPLFSQRPRDIFDQISSACGSGSTTATVGFDDLTRWEELQELLADGEILASEVKSFYDASKISACNEELDEAGFEALYNMIDDLFEADADDIDDTDIATSSASAPINICKEEELLALLTNGDGENQIVGSDKLPCGMDSTDERRDAISTIIEDLVSSADSNQIATIQAKDLLGAWDLLYTSSKAMILNKSLSGLTASGPDQEILFSGVRQTFTGSKFLGFVEFVETFNRGDPDAFDVKITGEWLLQKDTPTLEISPDNIEYSSGGKASGMTEAAPVVQMGGGMSQVSEWQSLGPIKLLEVVYVSPDLYIAQGKFESSGVFVWTRVE